MTNYKLYSSTITTADGLASLDVVQDGKIDSVLFVIEATGGAGVGRARVELSFASASGFFSNDTRSSIAQANIAYGNATTAVTNQWLQLPDIPVNAGERLYIHGAVSGTANASATVTVYVFVLDKGDGGNRRVRL